MNGCARANKEVKKEREMMIIFRYWTDIGLKTDRHWIDIGPILERKIRKNTHKKYF